MAENVGLCLYMSPVSLVFHTIYFIPYTHTLQSRSTPKKLPGCKTVPIYHYRAHFLLLRLRLTLCY